MEASEAEVKAAPEVEPAAVEETRPADIDPDLPFIMELIGQTGGSFKKCFQCGTCSGTCALSPETAPFPRKEMAWAVWGLKQRLMQDPDVWLCHQCNDCSTVCPRGGRPGDVLAAVRRACIGYYAFPRFLARWAGHPRYIPLMLAIPAILLALALLASKPLGAALGIERTANTKIVYAYSSELPHWVINSFFGTFAAFVLLVMSVGVVRFWLGLKAPDRPRNGKGPAPPARGMLASILIALGSLLRHDNFDACTASRPRMVSHFLVFFGFFALAMVSFSAITARYNPLFTGAFVYPFNFWSPFKILANLGGLAVIVGCVWMGVERLRDSEQAGRSSFADWALLWALFLVTASGFATEVLHYLRLEPHRHAVYFTHLVFAFALLVYMPYSKFAHMVYRFTAMVYAERIGRGRDLACPALSEEGEQ